MAPLKLESILLAYWIFVISFPFGCPVIAEETTDNYFNDSILIQTYKEEICQLKDTCNITDQIPQSLQDLRTRNCMCDRLCPFYRDCCRDANLTEVSISLKLICTKTRFDGNVYMIKSCPRKWAVKSVKEKCLFQNSAADILLKLPVTSNIGITYANVFCAICNSVDDYVFWNIGFTYKLSESKNNHSTIGVRDVLAKLSFDETDESVWSSYVNESLYKCYLEPKVPSNVIFPRYCVPDVIRSCKNGEICDGFTSYTYSLGEVYKNLECARCNNRTGELKGCQEPEGNKFDETMIEIPIMDSLIPKVDHCDDFPPYDPALKLLCKSKNTSEPIEDCSPVVDPIVDGKWIKRCYVSKHYYLSRNEYFYINDETVYIYEYNMEYPVTEWTAINNDRIFLCGTEIPRTRYERIMDSIDNMVTKVLIKMSIFCILLHLLKFWLRPTLRNLFQKNLASSCVALLIAFLSYEIGPWLPSCKITAIIKHYGFLSSFTWTFVISYDIWLNIYRGTVKLYLPSKERDSKFLIYSIIAWVIPAFAVGPAVFAEFTPSNVVSCDFKPGYGKYNQCFIARPKPHNYFFGYPAFVLHIANVCFFARTAYLIYSSSQSVNGVKRNNFKVYFKLGLLMGVAWNLDLWMTISSSELIGLLFTVLILSQGIFIFFLFTLDEKFMEVLLHFHVKTFVPESVQMGSL